MSVVWVLLSYLSGSVPFGLILTRAMTGRDVRCAGSGNIGATNVARVAGKKLGALVLILDALKGALPVLLAQRFAPDHLALQVAVGLAAVLGHVFPLWLKGKGGKGVATTLGVLLVLTPFVALIGLLVFIAVFAAFRISSVASLFGALAALVAGVALDIPVAYSALNALLLLLMLFTHRDNLRRLMRGAEHKL